MRVVIRLGRGPKVTKRPGKNSRIALLGASLMTMGAICLASMGLWRVSVDVDLAGDFVFTEGLLSHWQIWFAAAALTQYGAWRLNEHAKAAQPVDGTDQSGGAAQA